MTTKTLQVAMDKAASLPRQAQEEIAREVLERVSSIEQTRGALKVGLAQLDAGLGEPLNTEELRRRARREHETKD
jgi:hypothetical protein